MASASQVQPASRAESMRCMRKASRPRLSHSKLGRAGGPSNIPEWRTVLPDIRSRLFGPKEAKRVVGWAVLTCRRLIRLSDRPDRRDAGRCYRMRSASSGHFVSVPFDLVLSNRDGRDGLDWTNRGPRRLHKPRLELLRARSRGVVKAQRENCRVLNSGHMRRGLRSHYANVYSHVRSKVCRPTGCGYEHFPLSAWYIRPVRHPFVGMTGKFHSALGRGGG